MWRGKFEDQPKLQPHYESTEKGTKDMVELRGYKLQYYILPKVESDKPAPLKVVDSKKVDGDYWEKEQYLKLS